MKMIAKRKAGSKLGRDGLAEAVINLATVIANGSYKEAIAGAGKMAVLAEACTFDEYWKEKMLRGRYDQEDILEQLLSRT